MEKPNLLHAFIVCLAFCIFGSASASPQVADPGLLSLVPPGAAIVAEVRYGPEPTLLVLTRNNTADLMDLQSISGVDPTRTIGRTIFVADRGSEGLISEHSLLASGQFDSRRIFKAALENGASLTEYFGIPVLIVRPLDRDRRISRDLRWLAVIDARIAVFGTIPMVREELSRYLTLSPADLSLTRHLTHLHSEDQSWCVLTPTVHNRAIVHRTLASLDRSLGEADHPNDGLILGIHFGRRVDIEYETLPEYTASEESQPETQPGFPQTPSPEAVPPASHFLGNSQPILHRMIRLSKKQYDEFIAQEEARELCQRRTGVECRQESK
jgi:hypothetical protein